jgi:hypothetical protein
VGNENRGEWSGILREAFRESLRADGIQATVAVVVGELEGVSSELLRIAGALKDKHSPAPNGSEARPPSRRALEIAEKVRTAPTRAASNQQVLSAKWRGFSPAEMDVVRGAMVARFPNWKPRRSPIRRKR